MKKYLTVVALSIVILLSSCISVTITKPELVTQIKKVAIISLTSAANTRDPGSEVTYLDIMDDVYLDFALGKATEALTKIGWEVPDPYSYNKGAVFQKFKTDMKENYKKEMKFLGYKIFQRDWRFQKDLAMMDHIDSKTVLAFMTNLAKELDVDAVAAVSVEFCLRMKPGEDANIAVPFQTSVGMGLKVVTRNGDYVVLDNIRSTTKIWNTDSYVPTFNYNIDFTTNATRQAYFKATELAADDLANRFKR